MRKCIWLFALLPLAAGCTDGLPFLIKNFSTVWHVDGLSEQYLSANSARNASELTWQAKLRGDYVVKLNRPCQGSQGMAFRGTVNEPKRLSHTIDVNQLKVGYNSVYLCFKKNGSAKWKSRQLELIRDDTPPQSFADPAGGIFDSALTASLTCQDEHCLRTVYTLDGSAPHIGSDGSITNGMEFTESLALADGQATTLRFLSVDRAGNIETEIKEVTITVDAHAPHVDYFTSEYRHLSQFGHQDSQFNWLVSRQNLEYTLHSGNNCNANSIILSDATGSPGSWNCNYGLIADGADVTYSLCVENLAGKTAQRTIKQTRDDSPPTFNPNVPSGTYTSGPFTFYFNCLGNCERVAYTLNDPTDPNINELGEILYGSAAPLSLTIPDGQVTTLRYRAIDRAGNISAVGTSTFTVDSVAPSPTIISNEHNFLSSSGYLTSDISLELDRPALALDVRLGGTSCSTATLIESISSPGATLTYSVDVADLSSGANTLRLCQTNLAGTSGGSIQMITRDDTAPTAGATPAGGNFSSAPSISLSCSDNCTNLIYTLDNSAPSFSPQNGTIYSGPIAPPDQATTVVRFLARDMAGNLSSEGSQTYVVDSDVPQVTLGTVTPSHRMLSVNATTSAAITWASDRTGLDYEVRIDSSDCTDGSLSTGSNASGTTSSGNVTTTIPIGDLAAGDNLVRICVFNLIGTAGSNTVTIVRDDESPKIESSVPEHNDDNVDPELTSFTITIDEDIVEGAAYEATVVLQANTPSGGWVNYPIELSSSYNSSTNTYTVTKSTYPLLPENTDLRIAYTFSDATDVAGNAHSTLEVVFRTISNTKRFTLKESRQTFCTYDNGTLWQFDNNCLSTYTPGDLFYPFGQDAHYSLHSLPSYSLTSNPTYPSDYITTDLVTGLIWKRCALGKTGATCSGSNDSYNWYDGIAQCDALNDANSGNGFAGRVDWRLPTIYELSTIIDRSLYDPAADETYFPGISSVSHFTTTTLLNDPDHAWAISFDAGETLSNKDKSANSTPIRCVAGDGGNPASFMDGGLVSIDTNTGLHWQRCAHGQGGDADGGDPNCPNSANETDWVSAVSFCENLTLGGNSDWRLPTVNELFNIQDEGREYPSIDTDYFPNAPDGYYWTSTNYVGDPSEVWIVNFIRPWIKAPSKLKTDNYVTRCVRGP